jgi:hypothetical protein
VVYSCRDVEPSGLSSLICIDATITKSSQLVDFVHRLLKLEVRVGVGCDVPRTLNASTRSGEIGPEAGTCDRRWFPTAHAPNSLSPSIPHFPPVPSPACLRSVTKIPLPRSNSRKAPQSPSNGLFEA